MLHSNKRGGCALSSYADVLLAVTSIVKYSSKGQIISPGPIGNVLKEFDRTAVLCIRLSMLKSETCYSN